MQLKPGPGRLFVQPDERHKIRSSGLLMPTIAQDDADHGVAVAVGAPAWLGRVPGQPGLTYDRTRPGWKPVRAEAPCRPGDQIFYDCTKVIIMPIGWGDEKVYILNQRDVLGVVEEAAA